MNKIFLGLGIALDFFAIISFNYYIVSGDSSGLVFFVLLLGIGSSILGKTAQDYKAKSITSFE